MWTKDQQNQKIKFSDLLRPMSAVSSSASSASTIAAHIAAGVFEPEITIRKIFKCCNVDRDCHGCNKMPSIATTPTPMMPIASATTSAFLSATAAAALVTNHKTASMLYSSPNKLLATAQISSPATKQFFCTMCSFACTWKYDLKLHLKQKHGIHKK